MTNKSWFFAGFGVAFGIIVILAVVVDIAFLETDTTTISRRTWYAGIGHTWIAVMITGMMSWVSGALCGHFFLSMSPPVLKKIKALIKRGSE